ncbi:MAG TPA: S46 family peptidase, partial [Chthoniobacteraceae bacterium]
MRNFLSKFSVSSAAILFLVNAASADEGMWLFSDPPRQLLKERYGFEPTPEWLEHVRKSSVRFNSGGSGSFVSPDGLIITNHHVGASDLQKLSDGQHDYMKNAFRAKTRAEEKRCLDLELNVLMDIENVTDRVNAAVKPGATAQEAFAARRSVMAEIENESLKKTGLRSDVVTLYEGGEYDLYRYKRYTDVRLVFAPEMQAAFFGGDPDNFEFPRYNFDICLFRAYENGQPAKVEHYLKWSPNGVSENELVFVSGNPGRTNRQFTISEIEYLRDHSIPLRMARLNALEVMLTAWSARSDENARRAKEDVFGVQNSRKATVGTLAGLLDPQLYAAKADAEKKLIDAVAARPDLKDALPAWDQIREAQKTLAKTAREETLLERGQAFDSSLFDIARTLMRWV